MGNQFIKIMGMGKKKKKKVKQPKGTQVFGKDQLNLHLTTLAKFGEVVKKFFFFK